MGNFTLMRRANKAQQQAVVNYYEQQIGKKAVILDAAEHVLIYCDKGFINESHLVVEGGSFACFSGTPILSGTKNISETIRGIFHRLLNGKFDPAEIRGSYAFVFYKPGNPIQLGHDPVKVASVYADSKGSVISNSFIAAVLGTVQQLTLNKNALTELCLLGHITGNDSIYQEISKINNASSFAIPGIQWIQNAGPGRQKQSSNGFKEEVRSQLDTIESFFNDVAGFFDHYGVNLGISDGHDSRLLAGFFNKKLTRTSFYTFWRNKENKEIAISKQVAAVSSKELVMIPGKEVYDKTEAELVQNFEGSFYLYDGLARLHCYFFDDFNTCSFLHKLADLNPLNATGVGGEEYRNDNHLQFKKVRPLDFFYKHIIDQSVPGIVKDAATKKRIAGYMIGKFDNELKEAGLSNNKDVYDRYQLHFFFNEYHNNAFRMNRNNGENRYMMHIAPYLDSKLVFNSYASIPQQGISFSFQQEMIRQVSPELAKIISVYGYPFSKGEPLKDKIKYLIKHLTPNAILVEQRMRLYNDQSGHKLLSTYPALRTYLQVIEELDLPLDVQKLFLHADRWPLLLSLGFSIRFFETLKNNIAFTNE